eukprot:m.14709 g.14709  ORF g.14709 m.14709 type:complete len:74 (-) comp10512_c0_seq2:1069-1290(-)
MKSLKGDQEVRISIPLVADSSAIAPDLLSAAASAGMSVGDGAFGADALSFMTGGVIYDGDSKRNFLCVNIQYT